MPWLLLSAPSKAPARTATRLAHTPYIQWTATTGGLAPAAALCNASAVGTAAQVPHTADYYFWRFGARRRRSRTEIARRR
jgi:hypothetical protein